MKRIIKLIIITIILALAINIVKINEVQAFTYPGATTALQISNKIPSEVEISLKEIEFPKAESALKSRVTEILSAYDADLDVILNSSSGNIRSARVLLYYNDSSKKYYLTKNIKVKYSNTSNYNSTDKSFVDENTKNLSLNVDYKYEVNSDGTSDKYATWNKDVTVDWNSALNISGIKAVGVYIGTSGASTNSNYALNYYVDVSKKYYVFLFKNDVFYKYVTGNVKYVPTITVPNNVSDTDDAYVEYTSSIIEKIAKRMVTEDFTDKSTKVSYKCTPVINKIYRKSETDVKFVVNYEIERTSTVDGSKETKTGSVFYMQIAKNNEYRARIKPTVLSVESILKNNKVYIKAKFKIVEMCGGTNRTISEKYPPKIYLTKGSNIIDTNVKKDTSEADVYYFEIEAEKLYAKPYGEFEMKVEQSDNNNKYPKSSITISNSQVINEVKNNVLVNLKTNKLRVDKVTTFSFDRENVVKQLTSSNQFSDVNLEQIRYNSKTEKTITMTDEQIENVKYLNITGELYTKNDLEKLKVFKNVEYIVFDVYKQNIEYSDAYVTEYAKYLEFIANNFVNLKGLKIYIDTYRLIGYNKSEGFKNLSKLTKLENLQILVSSSSYGYKPNGTKYSDAEIKDMEFKEKFDFEYLKNMKNLSKILFSSIKIKQSNLDSLCALSNLENIQISCPYKSNITDITAINSLKKLQDFDIVTSANTVNINVNTKKYLVPFDYKHTLINIDSWIVDISSLFRAGTSNTSEKKFEITGATLSSDEKTVIFSNSARKGDKAELKYGSATITVTYMGDDYKYPDGSYVLGDINGDSKIDVNDAIMILKKITGKTVLSTSQTSAADVTKDSKVDVQDAIQILKYIVGKIKSF